MVPVSRAMIASSMASRTCCISAVCLWRIIIEFSSKKASLCPFLDRDLTSVDPGMVNEMYPFVSRVPGRH